MSSFESATVAQMTLCEEERPLLGIRERTPNAGLREKEHWPSGKKRRPRKAVGKTVRDVKGPAQMTPPASSYGQSQEGSKGLTPSRWPDILATPSEGGTVNIIDDILDFERKRLDQDRGTVDGVCSNSFHVSWMDRVDTIDDDDSKRGDGNDAAGQKPQSGLRADPEEMTLEDRQHGSLPALSLLLSSSPSSSKPLSSLPSAPSPPLMSSKRSSKRSSPSPTRSQSSIGSSAFAAKQSALGDKQEGVAQAAVIGYTV